MRVLTWRLQRREGLEVWTWEPPHPKTRTLPLDVIFLVTGRLRSDEELPDSAIITEFDSFLCIKKNLWRSGELWAFLCAGCLLPPLGNLTNPQIYLATDLREPSHAIIHLLNNKNWDKVVRIWRKMIFDLLSMSFPSVVSMRPYWGGLATDC